jgi:hypothetical protein
MAIKSKERASNAEYDLAIDYTQEAVPPLLEAERVWLNTWLTEQKLRSHP